MKHPLRVLGEPTDRTASEPLALRVGTTLLIVADAHDGAAARGLARLLVEAGASEATAEPSERADLRIVVRSTPQSPEARLRAEVLEESARVVLGSPRPAFARHLVKRLG